MSDPGAVGMMDVTFRYPRREGPALEEISLRVPEGRFAAVLGPNGAGKSTIVRLVAGLLQPERGRVELLGRELSTWSRAELARRVAVVSQEAPPGGIPLTVQDYVELGRNPYMGPWSRLAPADRAVIDRAISRTGLDSVRGRPLAALSGGERQRAKIARALAQEPTILLLDEPTVHLDLRHALWVFSEVRELSATEGVTVICVTHDLNMASRFADRIALLGRGRLLVEGTPEEVLESPALSEAFECRLRVDRRPGLGHFVVPIGIGDPAMDPA